MADERTALAADAYVYGYPLVYDLAEVDRVGRVGMGSLAPAPMNTFSHAHQLAGPQDQFVSVNNDTVYSIANLDLTGGPVLLRVPDTGGAYYVLQFVDAWTNNIAYVGRRATGTAAGAYLVVPPRWAGEVPTGATVIPASTEVVTIVGRLACDGPADLPRVAALQEGFSLRPLDPTVRLRGLPAPELGVPEDLMFFERMRVAMAAFPPAGADREYQERFRPLGLLAEASPYPSADAVLASALRDGLKAGKERVENASIATGGKAVNGWHLSPHLFDYNVSALGPGTIDSPQWKIADHDEAMLTRALAARVGLWGNHGYEATYAQVFTDSSGERLSGDRTYTMTFAEPPPVDAFWSLTMYDTPSYYLVDNPIGRYSIGDRTAGLRRDPSGALTVVMSHERPAGDDAANWLPAPAGDFRPMIRLYEPRPGVFDGSYALPPIVRVS